MPRPDFLLKTKKILTASIFCLALPSVSFADEYSWNWTDLSNPNWDISLTPFGYSDYLFDHTPGFVGREYLSGEWGAAVGYEKSGQTTAPTWLEPRFSFPDWDTNSTFSVINPTTITNTDADGIPMEATSLIGNQDIQIAQLFRLVDTVTGTPMGLSPASAGGVGDALMSNRYVLQQSYSITNISDSTLDNLQFFQLLHGLSSQAGVFDNRNYAGAFSDYSYDITLNGVDEGTQAGQKDYIGFSSNLAPTAVEIGYYGIEGNGVDDHVSGKPSIGTHLSIENNNLNGQDAFSPDTRWVAGAERWDLSSLAPGTTVRLDVMLTLLTGWQVGSDDQGGSGNGGSTEVGGVDYEFFGSHSDGEFFISYHAENEANVQTLIAAGEIGTPNFYIPGGKLQLFEVDFTGEFEGLLKLTFGYDQNLVAELDPSLLRVFHWNDDHQNWENLGGIIDENNHTISITTNSLSPFAVAAVPLPSAVWLFGSSLLGLLMVRTRKQA